MTSSEYLDTLTEEEKDKILAFNTLLSDEVYQDNFTSLENDSYKRGRLDVLKQIEMKIRGVDE